MAPHNDAHLPSDAILLDRLLRERRSCRAYLDRPVDRDTIERMLTIAQRAASWCNTQPWQVLVTSGEGTERFRAGLQEHAATVAPRYQIDAPKEYHGVYRERRRASGWALYEAVGVQRGDREASARQAFENFRLFGAPHVAIITTDAGHGSYGALDGGLYIGTLLLAAQSLGLGAVAQASIASHSDFVRSHFGIGEDRWILAGVSFGHPDPAHPANSYRTERAPLDEIVSWVDR